MILYTHYEKFFTMNHTQGEVVEGIGSNWTRSAEIDSEKIDLEQETIEDLNPR